MANPPYNDGNEPYEKNAVPGFFGFAGQGRKVTADTEGFFGFSAGKATNTSINVLAPARSGGVVRNLQLLVTYSGQAQPEIIDYDTQFAYDRQYPTDTLITIASSGGEYLPMSVTFTILPNQGVAINLNLEFGRASTFTHRRVWS